MKTLVLQIPDSLDVDDRDLAMLVSTKLYEQGKLSLGQAAEVAGLTKRTFAELHKISSFILDHPTSMKSSLLLFFCLLTSALSAQFQVGHSPSTFTDPSRNNRAIQVEMYYPATSAGDLVPLAPGSFPFIVFGHGFVMDYTAYQNITDVLVAEGYVLIYVETEGGLAPAHADFGLDLAFMADHFYDESLNVASLFYNHLIDRCAIMGHSMGGGSTWLAASTSTSVDCIAGLAPAETNPSAIAAASNVTVPTMVLSGSSDAVTTPTANHTPIFESTASDCKYFVNIIDGSHCGFANSGSFCDFGEFGFNGLSRAEQQALTHALLLAYFDFYLRDNATGFEVIQNFDSSQSNTETQIACVSSVAQYATPELKIFPNPCSELLYLPHPSNGTKTYSVLDLTGRVLTTGELIYTNGQAEVSTIDLPIGVYTLLVHEWGAVRFVKY
jgi:dienelactone hydrolase